MRLSKFTFAIVGSALVCTFGIVRPISSIAGESRYTAYYYQDDDAESDEEPSDEPPAPLESSDDMPAEEATDEESPSDDAPPAEVPSDDEPLERLPGREMPDDGAPPTPLTDDDQVDEDAPRSRRSPRGSHDTAPPPAYTWPIPGQGYATRTAKGWGYNGGCCASVWDGYCDEMHDCDHFGHGALLCRMMGNGSGSSCGMFGACGSNGCGCRQHRCSRSSCGQSSVVREHNPPPRETTPYASAARSNRKNPAVVLQHWDMPRITSSGKNVRR
jgi:hypothetical protein